MILFVFFKGFKLLTEHEVFDAFVKLFGVQLTEASSEVAFRELWVNLNRLVEIVDGQLVIAHILVHNSSRNENCFIVRNLFQNLAKALECFLELIRFVVHQS